MKKLRLNLTKHQKTFIQNYARLKEKYPSLYIRYQNTQPRGFYYHHVDIVNGVQKHIQHDIAFYLDNPQDGGDKPLHSRTIVALIKQEQIININHNFEELDMSNMLDGNHGNSHLGFILKQELITHVTQSKSISPYLPENTL